MILLFTKNTKGPDVGLDLAEGVDSGKFLPDSAIAPNPGAVQDLFINNGYVLKSSQGSFAKVMTVDAKGLAEIERGISRIEALGLKDVVNSANMSPRTFKSSFLDRLEDCKNAGLPFLNPDNTFIKALDNRELLDAYIKSNKSQVVVEKAVVQPVVTEVMVEPVAQVAPVSVQAPTPTVLNNETQNVNAQVVEQSIDDIVANMDAFDQQLYYNTIETLNYLVLANATNNTLASIISALPKGLAEAIDRQEYQFLGTRGMVNNIMEELGVVPGSPEAEMILNAIPEMEISVGRGRAA